MNRRPLLAFVVCWVSGDAMLSLWDGKAALLAFAGALLLLGAGAVYFKASPVVFAACAAAMLLAGGERAWTDWRYATHLTALLAEPDGQTVELTGRIASVVEVDGDIAAFQLKATSLKQPETQADATLKESFWIRVRLEEQEEQQVAHHWRRGDLLRVQGEIQLPADAGNFGGFDYRAYLDRKHIHWLVSAKGAGSVERTEAKPPLLTLPLRWADEARERISLWMDSLYGEKDAGFMKGLVAGIQEDIDPEQYTVYSNLGLTHVLAVSGLHFGVIVFILLRLFAWLRFTRERAIELTIAALPVYMLLTGASPSAIRACLMGMIALYMARRNRLKDGLHLLAASALVMLVWDPLVIENVSFQLSFIVTAGLLLFVPTVTEQLPIRWRSLRGALAVAVTAQAVSFPVSAYYFHQFHLLSLPANLVLVPFISFVVMPLGMASAALALLWRPLGALAADAASWCNRLTEWVLDALAGVPGMQTFWPQPSLLWVAAAYAIQFVTIAHMKRSQQKRQEREALDRWMQPAAEQRPAQERQPLGPAACDGEETRPLFDFEPPAHLNSGGRHWRRLAAPAAIALLWAVWLAWGFRPAALDRQAGVMFLDVGQGDSILIRSGEGRYGLIDTGGTVQFGKANEEWRQRKDPYEVGKKTVVPLLKQRGVRSLDFLLLTHLDQDHIGGAEAVLGSVPVKRLIFNGSLKPDKSVDRLFRLAERLRIPIYAVSGGMSWQWDRTASLQVLFPAAGDASGTAIPEVEEQNERSIVTLLALYGRTFLLPGDLEAAGERQVLEELGAVGEGTLKIDVLKAGHHGSRTSTTDEWLDSWHPTEAVISVGRNNVYGHPAPIVLDRIAARSIPVYRTDLNGEVQYRVTPEGGLSRRVKRDSHGGSD
ncbi:ComEC/Rec2 family competence protein [Cohnella lubricantis]